MIQNHYHGSGDHEETQNSHNTTTYNTTTFIQSDSDSKEVMDWKNQLISIIENVPAKANAIKPVIRFIITVTAPVKIYQIHHKDTPGIHMERYIDLLVIVPDNTEMSLTEMEPVLNLAWVQDRRVCCSLHRESTVMEAIKVGHIFYSLHCVSENLVYDNEAREYTETSSKALIALKERLFKEFTSSIVNAQSFYNCAIFLQQGQPPNTTAFMLHQAVELTYRITLQTLNGYDKNTHEIRILKKHARRCAPQLNIIFPDDTPEEKSLLDLLEMSYYDARYKEDYSITKEEVSTLSERVKLLLDTAKLVAEINLLN